MKILSRLCILGSAGTSISWRAHGVNAQSYGAGDGMDLPTGPMEDASLLQSRFRKRSRSKAREAREARKHPFHLDRHDHHHAKIVDTADYRADAAAFFEKVKNQSLEERCPHLHKMTLDQVHKEWKRMFSQLEKTTGNMTAKNKLAANYDLHFEFNSVLAGEMPVLVTGHVPKQLGWEAATHWGRDELSKHMGTLPWQKFTFNYPEWLIGMDQWESLDDYIKHNESSQNIFLFASEGGCSEEAKLKNSVDAIRRQFAPSPDFAFGPEDCMAIVAIDAQGSSHGFHSHDPVWNVQVEGFKQWWLLPPNYVSSDTWPEGGQKWGAAPLLPSGEAFQYPNACAMLQQATPPPGTLTCVTGPGEMLLLPDEWIHATCGLTEFTAAAGGWLAYHDD
mmetsp:Transcript_39932/g.95262  ORF Transcript_39932/g.95262 Transcript_39932/m.95262 type:complete len:391 (-) Transcript_39932:161-1333(-)